MTTTPKRKDSASRKEETADGPQAPAEIMATAKSVSRTSDTTTVGRTVGESRGPVKQFREDDVSAAIFARERNGMTFHSVSFTRSYKDRDGQWKYTKNFDTDDLGKIVTVTQRAAEFIHGLANPDKDSEG